MVQFQDKRVMIVVAHPDDELLGLGASMNKLISEKQILTRVVILGEGITSRADFRDTKIWETELKHHRENIFRAQETIGYHEVHPFDLPDNRFDTIALLDIIKIIEREKTEFLPDIVFTHHGGDLNIDHRKTFEAVLTACRPMEKEGVKTIISFETPSGTEWRASTEPFHFNPNLFVEISEANLNAKIAGMEAYEFEKRSYPHPRSAKALEVLAERWGIAVGVKYAEAFTIVRHVQTIV